SKVARLEEFPRSRVERVGGRRVVQYRGEILPLIDVDRALGAAPPPGASPSAGGPGGRGGGQGVVYAGAERPVGLVVDRILDIVEQDSDVQGPAVRPGGDRTAVIGGHVTEMLNVEALIRAAAGG